MFIVKNWIMMAMAIEQLRKLFIAIASDIYEEAWYHI